MKTNAIFGILLALALLINLSTYAQKSDDNGSKIQVALLLDTSNSMDGLIDQAKTELWSVVNELATTTYKGNRPELEIALYEYGNDNLESADGYVRLVSPLTTDLDAISEQLFSLKTNGGYEYCGTVIRDASDELKWSKSDKDLKMIFIAGNEEFTQGAVDYKTSCKNSIAEGIIINTIFCGNATEGINTMWKDGADLADGKYMNINQNQQVSYIETPFDDQILGLNTKLNKTYIGYGSQGEAFGSRQSVQDINAVKMSKKASVGRAVSKSSSAYRNSNWDLVDAVEDESVDIEEIKEEQLPEEMKGMDKKERKAYVEGKKEEREKIQKQINALNKKREAFIAKEKKNNAEEGTLGSALIKVVREQAQDKNYIFEK
ncbi:MAG: VWA domain-containing protein [Bacteroidota bacterium]|nr:VWA domain-containing protein [Bacteroidota bacterium]